MSPVSDRVSEVYQQLSKGGDDYVFLSDLRAALPDVSREDLDRALVQMQEGRKIVLDPYPLRSSLTPEQRAAGLQLGPQEMHMLVVTRDVNP